MTDDELTEAVRASLSGRRAPQPATQEAVLEAEAAIGFLVPTVLRRLYVEVANGGFGPRFAVMGVRGHDYFTCDDYADIVESYGDGPDEESEYGFPGLVWPLDWGCAIWSACDFRTPDGPMWGWDPNTCCLPHATQGPDGQGLAHRLARNRLRPAVLQRLLRRPRSRRGARMSTRHLGQGAKSEPRALNQPPSAVGRLHHEVQRIRKQILLTPALTDTACSGTRSAARSHARNPATLLVIPATMTDVEEVEVVVAHHERATVRVGEVFLKIDADQTRTDVEVAAMALAPVPTPRVLWRKPPVLALAALPGTALGRLGEPSSASPAAWVAAGAAVRMLHDAPLPPWSSSRFDDLASRLDGECERLVVNGVLPADLVTHNRRVAEAALQPSPPVFAHGDLQIGHVFVDGDEISGVIDWSEAGRGDALFDLASLTLGHEEHLGDVVAGYGTDVDLDVIRAWWSLRSLLAVRWLVEHGFDPFAPGCEVDVLKSRL
jgi:aminoglycoside phosphotransferase